MTDWKRELSEFAESVTKATLRAARVVPRGGDGNEPRVVGYRGYGAGRRALVLGRVLRGQPATPVDIAATRWTNLLQALGRVDADPIPFARVRAALRGTTVMHRADDEGFVRAWIETSEPLAHAGWHDAHLELASEATDSVAAAQDVVRVLVPSRTAAFGVISDMDDTVLQSRMHSFLRAVRVLLLENAKTRLPFPGVAAFYRALHANGNPIFYVSGSPWNLYDVIAGFLEAQEIPAGPLLLRDWDASTSLLRTTDYKLSTIREILATYPTLPFLLVGDSSQHDPEIYATLVRENPGRILAVYIRNVTPGNERSEAIKRLAADVHELGATLVLADDTLTVARHAAEHGWIAAGALEEIAGEKHADEGTTTEKAAAPGTDQGAKTKTMVVDADVSARDVDPAGR